MSRTKSITPFAAIALILTACGKTGGDSDPLPGPNNNALGLRASDCGEHVKNILAFWEHLDQWTRAEAHGQKERLLFRLGMLAEKAQ